MRAARCLCLIFVWCSGLCDAGGANLTNVTEPNYNPSPDQNNLFRQVYGDIFTLKDGSSLAETDTRALDTIKTGIQRLLGLPPGVGVLGAARTLPNEELVRILFLAVAGNFTVADRLGSGSLQQKCALVVDPGTGELMLRDGGQAQSVILEVLLIVSILCLMRSWGLKQ